MAEIRASSPAAVASWRPSVPRNVHRGPLLFSLMQRMTFCLFGSVSGRLLGRRALGVGCCLRCKLGSLRSVALFA